MVAVSPFARRTVAAACWWDTQPGGRMFPAHGQQFGHGQPVWCPCDSSFSRVLVTNAIRLQTQPR